MAGERPADDLWGWWEQTAQLDAEMTLPKVEEYGSDGADLVWIGRTIAEIAGFEGPFKDQDGDRTVADETFYAALGCHFYLVGKIARANEAFRHRTIPKADTVFDTQVYATMIRRIKEVGKWG